MNKVQQGQSFIDMVCQLTGSFEDVLAMAILNEKSITDSLNIGDELTGSGIKNPEVVNLFSKKQPATENILVMADNPDQLEGIGYWIIEKTFKVN